MLIHLCIPCCPDYNAATCSVYWPHSAVHNTLMTCMHLPCTSTTRQFVKTPQNMSKKGQVWTAYSLCVLIKAWAPNEVVHNHKLAPCQLALLNRGPPASSKSYWGMLHLNSHNQTLHGLHSMTQCLCKQASTSSSSASALWLQRSCGHCTSVVN